MNRKEILEKIETVRMELAEDQFHILRDKILERKFHHHKSDRKWFLGRIIEGLRRKLMREIEFILEPLFDNQKEINLRLLEELNRLKKDIAVLEKGDEGKDDDSKSQNSHPTDQD
jgi:hypothetical protein